MIDLDKTTTEWNLSEEQMVYIKGDPNINRDLATQKFEKLGAKFHGKCNFDDTCGLYFMSPVTLELKVAWIGNSLYQFVKKYFHEMKVEEDPKFQPGDFIKNDKGVLAIYERYDWEAKEHILLAIVGDMLRTHETCKSLIGFKLASTCDMSDTLKAMEDEGMYYIPREVGIDFKPTMPLDGTMYFYLDYELNDRRVKVLTTHAATFNRSQLYSVHRFVYNNIFLSETEAKKTADYMNSCAELAWYNIPDDIME